MSAVMGSENVQMLYLSAYECKVCVSASKCACCAVIGPHQVENSLSLQDKIRVLALSLLLGSYRPYWDWKRRSRIPWLSQFIVMVQTCLPQPLDIKCQSEV